MFGDMLVERWHWKKSRFERLSPLPEWPVSGSQSLRVSRLVLNSARETFKRNNLSHARGKMLVWLIKSQNGATSVCLQKKKKKERKEKKRETLGSDLRGRQRAYRWVGYVSPNKHTIYRTDTGLKLLFILLFFFFFYSSRARFKKQKKKKKEEKKTAAELAGNRKG